jgi:DNA-binding NarL/FixJ family response regulator
LSIEGDGDGLDLLPRLRALLPQARIVMFTAHSNAHQQQCALSIGASDYVVKDGDLSPLLDSLAH